ncbi:MAG: type I-C CRISPR-associated endonuclease Cas1c [bacterium]|jgi:CRISPR-associated protein Cas1
MDQLANTLYVMTPGAYIRLDHETVKVQVEGNTQIQVPLHHLGGIICCGNILVSPGIIHKCAEDGRFVVMLDSTGRFKARIAGPTSGNVLLRCAQHKVLQNKEQTVHIARNIVAGKIKNTRTALLRGAREIKNVEDQAALKKAAVRLGQSLAALKQPKPLNVIRGIEGEAARTYFSAIKHLILVDRDIFLPNGRTRRPPRDNLNALLSFLYALILSDCVAAAEGVGLDPQVGFLHAIRPGRPALALDLMEEFRVLLGDRVAITLINRRQITPKHFEEKPGGSVYLNDAGRREVAVAYQKRKQEKITHLLLERSEALALIPHIQARLLARTLRGDLEQYPPFVYR